MTKISYCNENQKILVVIKLMALVIAAVMVVGSMSLAGAANGNLIPDSSVTISGLEDADVVNLYKVFEWVDGEGWNLTTDFNTADIAALTNIACQCRVPLLTGSRNLMYILNPSWAANAVAD